MDSGPLQDQDTQWVRRAQRGEAPAFGTLVEKYRQRVFSLVYRLVRRRDEVEDIAQEIFVKAFLGIRSYNFQSSFATWLSRVAVNHCYDYLRRQRTSRVSYFWQMSEDGQRALEDRAEASQGGGVGIEGDLAARDLVDKLLRRAPAEDRVILGLKELDGRSVEEIGEILGLKESTVKVRLHRARKRMLEDLKRWEQGR
jgi:RNA polymerase sigma-70 factor (ECF subfamily)